MLAALVLTALFGMPALIRVVVERDYPELKRENGGSFVGSVWNALRPHALLRNRIDQVGVFSTILDTRIDQKVGADHGQTGITKTSTISSGIKV